MSRKFDLVYIPDAGADYASLGVVGELDSHNLKSRRADFLNVIETCDKKYLLLNMQNTDFINSEGISFLLHIHAELSKKQQVLVMISPKKNVEDVLNVIGLFESIPVFQNVGDFLRNKQLTI